MDDYLALVVMLVLAVAFVVLSLTVSRLLAPGRPTAAKAAPYESGIIPNREPPERFPVRFYLVAMIFIIFDIEIIFLYPWAVIMLPHGDAAGLGVFGLVEMLIFALAVFVSFVYLISNGALDWGPVKRLRRMEDAVVAGRTTDSAVRHIGRDGQEVAA
jgi:NADH-quinone oxidoreductase subunit A